VSSGETVTISTNRRSQDEGLARFTTNGQYTGTEYAYLAKNINEEGAYARGEFLIIGAYHSQLLKDDGDTFYLMRFANGYKSIASAGVRREAGVDKWALASGGSFETASEVFTDQWYTVELHYNPLESTAQMFVDGKKILQINVINTNLDIKQFDFGIVSATNIQDRLVVYADWVKLSRTQEVFEGKIQENSWMNLIPILSMVSFAILAVFFRKPILKTSSGLRYKGIKELKRMAEKNLILDLSIIIQLMNKISVLRRYRSYRKYRRH
jgi:hypothetical protein